ncbi:hypothetical protein ACSEQ9_01760 [Pseudomonas aeruginosa]|uniref:hypothetical protein n=1 Tax=Stenotrophomonas TaxID=40323 RepID=UPI000B063111|nr:hypothetical protein [Stenotrophomonas maltophilia]HBN8683290.1 hypothetical protein [Pseudomonas aeruginosa]HBO4390799.1 hypothetical protein [Pseudomonas aeruginosa]HEJ5934945.1 hypothetical protein [Pseudomonas aeruginosa]
MAKKQTATALALPSDVAAPKPAKTRPKDALPAVAKPTLRRPRLGVVPAEDPQKKHEPSGVLLYKLQMQCKGVPFRAWTPWRISSFRFDLAWSQDPHANHTPEKGRRHSKSRRQGMRVH